MWEWLSKADNLKTTGAIIGGLAQGYGAYQQSKIAKSMLDLQKSAYNRGVQREDKAQSNLNSAMVASFGTKKKKQPSLTLGGVQ